MQKLNGTASRTPASNRGGGNYSGWLSFLNAPESPEQEASEQYGGGQGQHSGIKEASRKICAPWRCWFETIGLTVNSRARNACVMPFSRFRPTLGWLV